MTFDAAYDAWLDDCLVEWNERFSETRTSHTFDGSAAGDGVEPWQLVEVAENGDAYPHGIGGFGFVQNAVTPWRDSPHWRSN